MKMYKYERLTKEEKTIIKNDFKKDNSVIYRKMNTYKYFSIAGIIFGILAFIFDYYINNDIKSLVFDVCIILFSIFSLRFFYNKMIKILNDYLLKIEKEKKREVLKKIKSK